MLNLKSIKLDSTNAREPVLDMQFEVRHNVGTLSTTLSSALGVRIDCSAHIVKAHLTMDNLEADSLENARARMAEWCDRTAAALRNVDRVAGDVPLYERAEFSLEAQPAWLQREFAVLAERYELCAAPDATETRSEILADLKAQHHPIVHVYGAVEQLEVFSYGDDD